jgi:hypothetical protein
MQPWRHNQSPAIPLVESAFSSGEESIGLIVPSTTIFCGYSPHWEVAAAQPPPFLPMDKSKGFTEVLMTQAEVILPDEPRPSACI